MPAANPLRPGTPGSVFRCITMVCLNCSRSTIFTLGASRKWDNTWHQITTADAARMARAQGWKLTKSGWAHKSCPRP